MASRAGFADAIEETLEGFEVAVAEGAWVAGEGVDRFHSFEASWVVKGEVEFIIIEHMEDHEIVAGLSQGGESFERGLFGSQKVGDEDHQASFGEEANDLFEDLRQGGFARGFGLLQGVEDGLQMQTARPPGEPRADLLIKRDQASGILLSHDEVGQASGDGGSVIELVERSTAVGHAFGNIDHEGATEVGIFLILFDVEAILSSPYLPIDMAQVVTMDILTMLNEFDRLAEVGASMHPRKKPFYDMPSPQFHAANFANCFRMQIFFGIGHHVVARPALWVCIQESVEPHRRW